MGNEGPLRFNDSHCRVHHCRVDLALHGWHRRDATVGMSTPTKSCLNADPDGWGR